MIKWLLIGLIAGSVAKMMTPQGEKGGWLSSLGIGVVGSVIGGMLAGLIGFTAHSVLAQIIIAIGGSLVFLYIYHKYLSKYF